MRCKNCPLHQFLIPNYLHPVLYSAVLPHGRLAQLVRAPALHAGCHRFESCTAHHLFTRQLSPPSSIGSGRVRVCLPVVAYRPLSGHDLANFTALCPLLGETGATPAAPDFFAFTAAPHFHTPRPQSLSKAPMKSMGPNCMYTFAVKTGLLCRLPFRANCCEPLDLPSGGLGGTNIYPAATR